MSRLFFILTTISIGTCAGIGVIIALTLGLYTWQAILLYGGIGAVVGVIAAFFVARQLEAREEEH